MNHFNESAKQWDTPEKIAQVKKLAAQIRPYLSKSPQKVLDFGCGTGLFGREFISEEITFHGADTSVGMLEVFQQKFSNDYTRAILLKNNDDLIHQIDKDYDLIVSSMTFHHLENPFSTLKILIAALNTHGHLIVVDLDQEDGSFHPDNKAMGVHHHGFSQTLLQKWADDLGVCLKHQIINEISKNDRIYGQFMAIYSRK